MDQRKKAKLTIETTLRDLNLLEDFWSTISSCNKHKRNIKKTSERELMTMYYVCKDCEKLYKNQNDAARRIEGKLQQAFWKLDKKESGGKNAIRDKNNTKSKTI